MNIPNEIKDLIHKYVLAIEHPVVKGLKDEHRKYWTEFAMERGDGKTYSDLIKNSDNIYSYSFYFGVDTAGGYQVCIPGSSVIGPYCYRCGDLSEVFKNWPQISYIPLNKLCTCDYNIIHWAHLPPFMDIGESHATNQLS